MLVPSEPTDTAVCVRTWPPKGRHGGRPSRGAGKAALERIKKLKKRNSAGEPMHSQQATSSLSGSSSQPRDSMLAVSADSDLLSEYVKVHTRTHTLSLALHSLSSIILC